jgi:CelD/BcsL family acetyltransferase involved in cellulose biosynthesis
MCGIRHFLPVNQSVRYGSNHAPGEFEEEMKSALAIATHNDTALGLPVPSEAARRDSAWPALATDKCSVVSVTDFALLDGITEKWEELAAQAVEPNPFYEPWMLRPALTHLGAGIDLRVVLVFVPNRARPSQPLLAGVFPLERQAHHNRLPCRTLSLWRHKFCQLATPLIRASHAQETLAAFFAWLKAADHGCTLMTFNSVSGEGPFHHLFVDYLDHNAVLHHAGDSFARAIFRPAGDAETYLRTVLSTKHRKASRRHEQQLAASGAIEYGALAAGGDVQTWLEEFMALEASGWKGRERSALASSTADRQFFISAATEAFRRDRFEMLALRRNGRMIAARCGFAAGSAAYTFKIAYDESYARWSPGVLLEIENIRRLHGDSRIRWMDSFTSRDNAMFNRLWRDRLLLREVTVGTGHRRGDFIVSLLPLLRWLKRRTKRAGL